MGNKIRLSDRIRTLEGNITARAGAMGVPAERTAAALEERDYFDLVAALLPLRERAPKQEVSALQKDVEGLLRIMTFGFPPRTRQGKPEPVVFGTGGHRGEIGVGLTLVHVHVIIAALMKRIELLQPGERLLHFGAETVEQVRERGFVIGHDNRLLNPDFAFYSAHLLCEGGYAVRYAGVVASPEISKVVPLMGWAGGLNFTPSHNPFQYGGIKFNPTDGGLAGGELTEPMAAEANRMLESLEEAAWPEYEELEGLIAGQEKGIERVDIHTPYLETLETHPVVRLKELIEELRALPEGEKACFVVDPVFGGAVPVYKRLRELLGEEVMTLINTDEDPYFAGQTTEPNEETLEGALSVMRSREAAYKVAIRNDPDGDRGLVGDEGGAIKMNRFAALVMRYLHDLGIEGDVVTTLPTSRFGVDYARSLGKQVHLTAVGFKNFRPYLLKKRAMVAYEESDGITIAGHTLDKDGVLAGLLALRMVLHYKKPLQELLREIERETGSYHYRQINFMVDITAAEVRQKLQKLASFGSGDLLGPADAIRKLEEVNVEDGYMFSFTDGTWILMRPSGTEPKVRIYAESRKSAADTDALCELGKTLALDAIQGR